MARKRKSKKKLIPSKKKILTLPEREKRIIWSIVFFLLSLVMFFSFFQSAGSAGRFINESFNAFVGKTIFLLPILFFLTSVIVFKTQYKKFVWPVIIGFLFFVSGFSGVISSFSESSGGWLGKALGGFFLRFFGFWIAQLIFLSLIIVASLFFRYLLGPFEKKEKQEQKKEEPTVLKIFKELTKSEPKLKIKEVESGVKTGAVFEKIEEETPAKQEKKTETQNTDSFKFPPLDLLEPQSQNPSSGDTEMNSAIIKRTLENFDIPVEMAEINIGPTVTQYTLKPSEGIKLSRITTLSNDLSLALAAHPIRIEAPVPGKSLVGVEVPNKTRAEVRLRNLIDYPVFQDALSGLTLVLGRDVTGHHIYTDLARMPHLLVAGATGSGKTIFLNTLILSLIYKNSPKNLRLILIDPKRVEFSLYSNLPHLLAPIIFNGNKTLNALKWLVGEMERRFEVLSGVGKKNIVSYNEFVSKKTNKNSDLETLPYIVLIIDELADLMAAKGREIEGGIVRIAQMARAVGIHLVLATQRPSVEVITGLIKANITSRISFQVASQVDSRTILDTSGAEKLLGAGDMLYISADVSKPRRVQSPYVSEKEIKQVVEWLNNQKTEDEPEINLEDSLGKQLSQNPEETSQAFDFSDEDEDSLYEEAKRVVIEAKKASASLLQRRLRVGYARAARLIDILEEKGVVGPGEGAKPREVFIAGPSEESFFEQGENENLEEQNQQDEWKKI